MNTFAFIGHFLDVGHFCDLMGIPRGIVRFCPRELTKTLIGQLPPYHFLDLPALISPAGFAARGYAIIAPFLPEHVATRGEQAAVDKVVAAGRLAERLGARLVGLAGFTSVVGDEGVEASKRLGIAVTSGNTLTAALALQGLRKASSLMGTNLGSSTAAVIGATGDIGSVCATVLAREVGRLQLAARNESRVEDFASALRRGASCDITVSKYVRDAVRGADLILTATSAVTTMIEPCDVKPGAAVCDVAIPHNVGDDILRQRDDVLVFEGGLAKLPVPYLPGSRRWRTLAPDGQTIFGCLAETLVLAFEGRWESYSLGRGYITPGRIQEMVHLAARHGIKLADFRYRGMVYSDGHLRSIRANALRNGKRTADGPLAETAAVA